MVRGLVSPKILIPISNSPPLYVLPRSPSHHSHSSSSLSLHHPSDELSERTVSAFRAVNLLKHNPMDHPGIIASIHCISCKTGVLLDLSARTSLLTAYARACDPESSLALFSEADTHDVVSWNAVINALVLNSHFETSVVLFQEMLDGFGAFDSTTLVILLSAMSRTGNLKHGTVLHGTIIKRRFDRDSYLCNVLIDMYAKCADIRSSESVFEEMEVKDAASWNSMIRGCIHNGFPEKSAFFFRGLSRSNLRADQVSLSCVISACSCLEELFGLGESVHGRVIKLGYEGMHHSSVSNSLISFYSRYGDVEAAEEVFRILFNKNVVSWNSMISGLVENEMLKAGLDLFYLMQSTMATEPDAVTVITVSQLCGDSDLLQQGKSVHGFTVRRGLDQLDSSISNSLLGMYLKCDDLKSSEILFSAMPNRDLVSWNTMIGGYSCNDSSKEQARGLFYELLRMGLRCSLATLLAILPSCSCPEDIGFGKAAHCWELKYGFANIGSAVNALILMYINCGDLTASSLLLSSISFLSDIVSWNTAIVGWVQNGYYWDALEAFKSMRRSSYLHPDPITFVSVLSACGNLGLLFDGKCVHGLALKSLMGSDVRVRNALLTMYFRCADTKSAESVFEMDGNINLCSWNCMISGFAQNKEGRKALQCFSRMESFHPNEFSVVGVLCACTQLVNLLHGKEIHGYVFRSQSQTNPFILSALVDMYSKCGRLDIAVRIFNSSPEKSVASWNSMISAYGFHGHGEKAIKLFSEMCELGTKPTKSTFIALLSACSHSGLVNEGWKQYNGMLVDFGMEPTIEHQVCMVDMLGRAGKLSEACEFVKKLSIKQQAGVWGALLSACNYLGDLKIAKSIAEHLFCIEPENTGYYVTLSNLYACFGMWSDVAEVRRMIQDTGLMKPPGCSSVDIPSK